MAVRNVTLSNLWVGLNGGWSIRASGYNNTVTNISVFGNGCGGIAVSGGDMVRRVLYYGVMAEKITVVAAVVTNGCARAAAAGHFWLPWLDTTTTIYFNIFWC